MQKRDAPCKRLLYSLHQAEDLRARHPKVSGIVMLVDVNFDIGKKLRRVLNLVDQHGGLVYLQKERGVVLRHVARGEVVQRHIFAPLVLLLRKRAKHRGLARLTRTSQKNGRIRLRQLHNSIFHMTVDVIHKFLHVHLWHFNTINIILLFYPFVNENFGYFQ